MENINLPIEAPGVGQIQELFGQYWWLLAILVLWSIIWKGIALWKSARDGSKVWFVIMLIVNTVGILEIIYIFAVSRSKSISAPQA